MKRYIDEATGIEYVLLEEGGPWVQVTPAYRPAPSGNPAEWTPGDRARLAMMRGDGATISEIKQALTDLVFWVYHEIENKEA